MDIPNRIAALMARSLTGEISPEDEMELDAYVQSNPEVQQQLENMKKLWKNNPSTYQSKKGLQSTDRQRIQRILSKAAESETPQVSNITKRQRQSLWQVVPGYLKYAAIVLFVMASGWFFFLKDKGNGFTNDLANERVVIAQKGSRTRTLLPDGTTVWLNSGSKISYKGNFKEATREVHLSGEAFFDVVKQPERPFIVHAGDINVKVLGTAFNVKFYEGDKTIETTLLRGSVEVTSQKNDNHRILLKPNEKLVVVHEAFKDQEDTSANKETEKNAREKDFQIIQFNTPAKEEKLLETAWIYNRLEFRDDSFEELANKLERWYNVHIVLGDETVRQFKFNGSFEKETIEEAMAALQKVHSFTFKINANEIVIHSSE